jgi:hypothetical protein
MDLIFHLEVIAIFSQLSISDPLPPQARRVLVREFQKSALAALVVRAGRDSASPLMNPSTADRGSLGWSGRKLGTG